MNPQDPTIQHTTPPPTGNIRFPGKLTLIYIGCGLLMLALIGWSFATNPALKQKREAEAKQAQLVSTRQYAAAQTVLQKAQETAGTAEATLNQQLAGQTQRTPGIPNQNVDSDGRPIQAQPPPDPVALDRKKHEWDSRFASTSVYSFRSGPAAVVTSTVSPAAPQSPVEPVAAAPTVAKERASAASVDSTLYEGTIIEAATANTLQGDFAGPVLAQVTSDVYAGSATNPVRVIPKGSRLIGTASKVSDHYQSRLAASFHRLIMTNGRSIDLDVIGLDQSGATALKDKVNHHYVATFATSIALGALGGLALSGTSGIYTADSSDMYRQSVARQLGQDASQTLNRNLDRRPTITIEQGHRIRIMLSRDIKLPAYDQKEVAE